MSKSPAFSLPHGATFDLLARIPDTFADGHFVGYTLKSQLRTPNGALIADLSAYWQDPATTRYLRLRCADTTTWPVGLVQFDICFTEPGGDRLFTGVQSVEITRGVTKP